MKTLITLLFLTSIVSAQDTLVLNPQQIKNVYIGLKQGEEYIKLYKECLNASDSLYSIVEAQDRNLLKLVADTKAQDALIYKLHEQELRIPWYRNRWLYLAGGLLTGYLIGR